MANKSASTSLATTVNVADALWNAGSSKGMHFNWEAGNDWLQQMIVGCKAPSLRLATMLNSNQLISCASDICREVNEFLANNGFPDVQLMDGGSRGMFYMASILKLLGSFFMMGKSGYELPEIGKPAFRLGSGSGVRQGCAANGQIVVQIPTNGNFDLWVTRPTGVVGFNMVTDWAEILEGIETTWIGGVILPMASIDSMPIDVTGLVGMRSGGWQIGEAKMAAKFSLTPDMVKFESAFACSAKRCMASVTLPEEGDYLADHPLYFALAIRDMPWPLAVGIVDVPDLADEEVN